MNPLAHYWSRTDDDDIVGEPTLVITRPSLWQRNGDYPRNQDYTTDAENSPQDLLAIKQQLLEELGLLLENDLGTCDAKLARLVVEFHTS